MPNPFGNFHPSAFSPSPPSHADRQRQRRQALLNRRRFGPDPFEGWVIDPRYTCTWNFSPITTRKLSLRADIADEIYTTQPPGSNWCWAACISMAFRYYGLKLSPYAIVQIILGGVRDERIGPQLLLQHMTRDWLDDEGTRFKADTDIIYSNELRIQHDDWLLRIARHLSRGCLAFYATPLHIMVLRSISITWDEVAGRFVIHTLSLMDPETSADRNIMAIEFDNTDFLAAVLIERV